MLGRQRKEARPSAVNRATHCLNEHNVMGKRNSQRMSLCSPLGRNSKGQGHSQGKNTLRLREKWRSTSITSLWRWAQGPFGHCCYKDHESTRDTVRGSLVARLTPTTSHILLLCWVKCEDSTLIKQECAKNGHILMGKGIDYVSVAPVMYWTILWCSEVFLHFMNFSFWPLPLCPRYCPWKSHQLPLQHLVCPQYQSTNTSAPTFIIFNPLSAAVALQSATQKNTYPHED